jgi:hypothetical protein
LKYGSLRNPDFWSKKNIYLEKESVGLIFFSPINLKTNMIGDIGFTLYTGENEEIKKHLKKVYINILEVAKYVKVGMSFTEICEFALNLFKDKFVITKWKTISSNPNHLINLGHTIPGSFEDHFIFGNNYEEIKENIRAKRVPIQEAEKFEIPPTCAFTLECRLEDLYKTELPSAYFHFIVCFDDGNKVILENFSEIFNTVGMGYMNTK